MLAVCRLREYLHNVSLSLGWSFLQNKTKFFCVFLFLGGGGVKVT